MKHFILAAFLLAGSFLSLGQVVSISELTPGSAILDLNGQQLVYDALPEGFRFEAELVYNTSVSGFTGDAFDAACDGLSHTLVVGISEQGNVFGGFNEGIWTDLESQSDLLNNFLFSVTNQAIYPAIPSQPHTSPAPGPGFSNDCRFFTSGSPNVLVQNSLGGSYECPDGTNCLCLLNNNIAWNNSDDRFYCSNYEVWQLKTSGAPALAVSIDYNEDGVPETTTDCYAQTKPVFLTSELLTTRNDALLASWLPEEFLYESQPLFSSNDAIVGQSNFLNNVAGFTNTIVLIRTEAGEIIGGYNEGFWSNSNVPQSNLDNNFIFNLSDKRRHLALPGEVHIDNGNELSFGYGDLTLIFSDMDQSSNFNGYSSTAADPSDTQVYNHITEQDDYIIDRIEVYQLNTTGEPIFLPADEDNNGICDHLDINNFISNNAGTCPGDFDANGSITASDLSAFLGVFGSTCD